MSDAPQQPGYGSNPPYGSPQQPNPYGAYPGAPGQPNPQPGASGAYPSGPPMTPGQAPGYPAGQPYGYGAPQYGGPSIGPNGVKYDASGKPAYPGTYLAAIIILGIGLALGIFAVIQNVQATNDAAQILGDSDPLVGQLRLLMFVTIITFVINIGSFIGLVTGQKWGRILYTAVFVINIIFVFVVVAGMPQGGQIIGGMIPSLILPILVIIFMWLPNATAYLNAMTEWRARR